MSRSSRPSYSFLSVCRVGALRALVLLLTPTLLTAQEGNSTAPGPDAEISEAPDVRVPPTISAVIRALGTDGEGLEGARTIGVTVWAPNGSEPLASESHQARFVKGRADIAVGSKTPELPQVLRSHPEVELEYTIDGEVQEPRVKVLVGGHSPASRAALSGPVASTPGSRTKAFRAAASQHAVQAVAVQPQGGQVAPEVDRVDGRRVYRRPFEVPVTYLGESRPLSELPRTEAREPQDVEGPRGREVNRPRHGVLRDENGRLFGTTTRKVQDSLVNRATRGVPLPAPDYDLNFEGVGNVNGVLPPDTEGAVGMNRYVQVVNLSFAIYNKAGSQVLAPTNTNTLWTGFGGLCESNNSGDAIFLYDQFADRFVLTQFTSGNVVCFAVETASVNELENATFHLYEVATQRFPDYYKVGIWPDADNNAYFFTTNSGFPGAYDIYAVDRANMLNGGVAAAAQFFQSFPNLFLPADVDGPTPPPAGDPALFYTIFDGGEPYFGNPAPLQDSIELYTFDVDWTTPGNSTFSQLQSLTSTDGLADFNWTVCGFFASSCLPQPGTLQKIDSASWWPMQRFVYRNFGSYESLLGAWTVDVNGEPDLAAPRWFELRYEPARGTDWEIHQQGTHSPDNDHRFMPSVAMDSNGNVAMGYSVTSSTTFPSIRYAVHEAGSTLGTMSDEKELIAGTGSQTSSSARWGDYASMEVDPADDCTFWFTTEYVETTGSAPWQTRVGTFRVPGCGEIRSTPPGQAACTTAGSVDFDLEFFEFSEATADLSVSGCPGGAVCTFDVDPVAIPGTSTLSVASLGSATGGDYTLTVTAAAPMPRGGALTKDLQLTLADAVPAVSLPLSPLDEATAVDPRPVTLTWTDVGAASYTVQVATDASFVGLVEERSVTGTLLSVELENARQYYWRVQADNACGSSAYSDTFTFSTVVEPGDCAIGRQPVALWEDDLESGAEMATCPPGWTCTGGTDPVDWELWDVRVFSGTRALNVRNPVEADFEDLVGEDFDPVSEQVLVSPELAVPEGADFPALRFWNYQEIENRNSDGACRDGGILEIAVNGGGWQPIVTTTLLTDEYDGPFIPAFTANPLAPGSAWCGDPDDWTESVVDLSAFAGDDVRFRFRYGTDAGGLGQREGWTLDDFSLTTCEVVIDPAFIFADGFESGNVSAWQ